MNMHVGGAGDARHPIPQLLGESCWSLAHIAPGHLQIDGRGQAGEFEDLVGDVGWSEEEHHVGEALRQALAQQHFVRRAPGPVLFAVQEQS